MDIVKEKSCCFTGHRPDKCIGTEAEIKKELIRAINDMIQKGVDTFITGMALGVDTWAAECVLEEKKRNPRLKLVCAVPWKGVEKKRSEQEQNQFFDILSKADHVEYICPRHTRCAFNDRNRWMVDHASRMIAVYSGAKGGTKYTIDYAVTKGIEPVIIDDSKLKGNV